MNKSNVIFIVLFLYSLLCFIVENSTAFEAYYWFFYLVGWVLFALYVGDLHARNASFVASMFYQMFYYVGMMLSATAIAAGAYMYQVDRNGFANGMIWICILYSLVGCEASLKGYLLGFGGNYSKDVFPKKWAKFCAKLIIVTVLGGSMLLLALYGSPLFVEVSREKYWGEVVPSGFSFIRVLVIITFYFPLKLYFDSVRAGRKGLIYLFCLFLYIFTVVVFLGEKFSVFQIYLFIWLIFAAGVYKSGLLSRLYKKIGIIVVVMLLNVAVVYEVMGLGYDFIYQRIALQGQVLWSLLKEDLMVLLVGVDYRGFFEVDGYNLRDFLDARYLPRDVYAANKISGTTLSGYMPAWQIVAFGMPVSLILQVAFSYLLGFVQGRVVFNSVGGGILISFSYFVMYYFLISFWFVGNFNLAIGVAVICYFLFLSRLMIRKKGGYV